MVESHLGARKIDFDRADLVLDSAAELIGFAQRTFS
jgi:hypothetical protein